MYGAECLKQTLSISLTMLRDCFVDLLFSWTDKYINMVYINAGAWVKFGRDEKPSSSTKSQHCKTFQTHNPVLFIVQHSFIVTSTKHRPSDAEVNTYTHTTIVFFFLSFFVCVLVSAWTRWVSLHHIVPSAMPLILTRLVHHSEQSCRLSGINSILHNVMYLINICSVFETHIKYIVTRRGNEKNK